MQSIQYNSQSNFLVVKKDSNPPETWEDITSVVLVTGSYNKYIAYSGSNPVVEFSADNTNLYYKPIPQTGILFPRALLIGSAAPEQRQITLTATFDTGSITPGLVFYEVSSSNGIIIGDGNVADLLISYPTTGLAYVAIGMMEGGSYTTTISVANTLESDFYPDDPPEITTTLDAPTVYYIDTASPGNYIITMSLVYNEVST